MFVWGLAFTVRWGCLSQFYLTRLCFIFCMCLPLVGSLTGPKPGFSTLCFAYVGAFVVMASQGSGLPSGLPEPAPARYSRWHTMGYRRPYDPHHPQGAGGLDVQ